MVVLLYLSRHKISKEMQIQSFDFKLKLDQGR